VTDTLSNPHAAPGSAAGPAATDPQPGATDRVGVIFPTGMLGGGFPPDTIRRGIELGADAIAVDGGSTDSGPSYLGTATAKTTGSAVARDLRLLLTAASAAGIPLIVTSCGTSGTDSGVDWIADMVTAIAEQEGLSFNVARIYSEQQAGALLPALHAGRIRPLPPLGPLQPDTLLSCTHIVGLMGHEPITQALDAGAQVVLAGRATDTSSVAALALRRGLLAGSAWHAAKTVECGGQCTTSPGRGGVYVHIDQGGFTVEPLDEQAACTPTSVAAHMIYENVDPFRMREPSGTLDTSQATYVALDDRRVRVEGSRFEPAEQYTVKLEGSSLAGYETVILVGIRDPQILGDLDTWVSTLRSMLTSRVQTLLGLQQGEYEIQIRCYGANAVLGPLEPETVAPREVGVLFQARAADQATATAIAKITNPFLLHLPLPGSEHLPSFAFATSPAEMERGAVYEFVLNHAVDVDTPHQLFRTVYSEVGHG
jgi:hypothetical protein